MKKEENKKIKEKDKIDKLINWSELSILLTNEKTFIRWNKIPDKYKRKVFELKENISNWLEWNKKDDFILNKYSDDDE